MELFEGNAHSDIPDDRISFPAMVTGLNHLEAYNPYPENKKKFIRFINAINASGYKVILIEHSTNRSYAQQAALKLADKRNASAGNSNHEFGRAIDITVVNAKTGKVCSKRTSEEEWRATGVPAIANQLGFRWGGSSNDGTFGTKGQKGYYIDRVHFELLGKGGSAAITEDIY